MSTPLPYLWQRVQLYPDEVCALREGLAHLIGQLLSEPGRLSYEQAYVLKPMLKVHRRLLTLSRPVAHTRPRPLKLEFDELVALRRQNGRIQEAGQYDVHLVGALGKVHQVSLQLDHRINYQCS